MEQNQRTSKGSNEKIHTFEVGDIVKIVSNHKPFSRNITKKYPHGKELINQVCFVEQVLGDRYSLYALEKPSKTLIDVKPTLKNLPKYRQSWYIGDILESCLEYVRKITTEELENYKHFIYSDDLEKILCRIKQQEIEEEQL